MNLDARQRAMLDEMGVKVWWPAAAIAAAPAGAVAQEGGDAEPVAVDVRAEAMAPARSTAAARPAVTPPAVPSTSTSRSPAPTAASRPAAAAAHGAGVLVEPPRRLYGSDGDATGGWLIVADMPPEVDGRHGEPFAGDAGRLLDNMLRALQLYAGAVPVHLMRTHRGVASGREGSPRAFIDSFAVQAAALAPRVVLAMGPLAAQSLLQRGEPLGKLRGQVAPCAALDGTPAVATYHPAYLLRTPADKARAWVDLCLAADAFGPPAAAEPGTAD